MARPNRRTVAYAKRRAKRKRPKLARGPSLEEPKDKVKPTTVTLSTAAIRRQYRRTQREEVRREPRDAAAKAREILVVSRKGQPQVFAKVKALERKNYPPMSVSSSWLSTIGYFYNEQIGTFTTQSGRQYKIHNFPFEMFEKWYYAHSKGTFFNDYIKDQYENNIKGTL